MNRCVARKSNSWQASSPLPFTELVAPLGNEFAHMPIGSFHESLAPRTPWLTVSNKDVVLNSHLRKKRIDKLGPIVCLQDGRWAHHSNPLQKVVQHVTFSPMA